MTTLAQILQANAHPTLIAAARAAMRKVSPAQHTLLDPSIEAMRDTNVSLTLAEVSALNTTLALTAAKSTLDLIDPDLRAGAHEVIEAVEAGDLPRVMGLSAGYNQSPDWGVRHPAHSAALTFAANGGTSFAGCAVTDAIGLLAAHAPSTEAADLLIAGLLSDLVAVAEAATTRILAHA